MFRRRRKTEKMETETEKKIVSKARMHFVSNQEYPIH